MKLGVVFDQEEGVGGGFHQGLNAVRKIHSMGGESIDICVIAFNESNVDILRETFDNVHYFPLNNFKKILIKLYSMITQKRLVDLKSFFRLKSPFDRFLHKHNVDCLYFISPTGFARHVETVPYITTVWDTCHRDAPYLPELVSDREFERREKNYQSILPKAAGIIVDSSVSKQQLISRYGVDSEKVFVIPHEPSPYLVEKRQEKNIPMIVSDSKRYVFYPAQYWPHKNHVYLLKGMQELKNAYPNFHTQIIFSGSDKGNLDYLKNVALQLGIEDRVIFKEYVSNDVLFQLYSNCFAVAMPTLLGPTNLPPLEAFYLEKPLLYSDFYPLNVFTQDACHPLDLMQPKSFAEGVYKIATDKNYAEELIVRGRTRLKEIQASSDIEKLVSHLKLIDSALGTFRGVHHE